MASQWRRLGPPLRPNAAEVQRVELSLAKETDRLGHRPLRGLILGVTPEIAEMNWPAGSQVLAVDRSLEMVQTVWPGDRPGRRVICSDWTTALSAVGGLDAVIGDCSLTSQQYPIEWNRLMQAAGRALADYGVLLLRCRIASERPESPSQVFSDLMHGRIRSFHSFKLRLAMALQPGPGTGVPLDVVWQSWNRAAIDRELLRGITGWPLEVIRTIDLYHNKQMCLTFPTLQQIRDLFSARFNLESVTWQSEELRAQHPMLTLRCRRTRTQA